ncbi:hypothetical protein HYX14_05690 [Candidatus Woesearchaeota archaeon]|nr:hypothetical protein [Candidatus Woesearchaeota archaeon]
MKKAVSVFVLFLLVLSPLTLAQDNENECSGFWGSISCFLWGNPENRAGKGWFDKNAGVN